MHREMCRTNTDRDCRRGGRGACRACPYRKGGAFYKTPAEQHEGLVQSWYHAVIVGSSAVWNVPWESCGRELQREVRKRVEGGYREVAGRLTGTQKATIKRMRRRAPIDVAEAAGCSTDDVFLWLLGLRRPSPAPFYAEALALGSAQEEAA